MDQTDALYRAVIGRNTGYYLERFRQFDQAGRAGASWHWPAFLVTFFWMLYRKMWGAAAAYVVLVLASYLVLPTVGWLMAGAGGGLAAAGLHLVLVLVVPPLFANALYYRHCRNRIEDTAALAHNPQARSGELERRGGTSGVAAAIGALVAMMAGVAFIAMIVAISVPAYQDYLERANSGARAPATGNAAERQQPE